MVKFLPFVNLFFLISSFHLLLSLSSFSLICHLPFLYPVMFSFVLPRIRFSVRAFSVWKCMTQLNSACHSCIEQEHVKKCDDKALQVLLKYSRMNRPMRLQHGTILSMIHSDSALFRHCSKYNLHLNEWVLLSIITSESLWKRKKKNNPLWAPSKNETTCILRAQYNRWQHESKWCTLYQRDKLWHSQLSGVTLCQCVAVSSRKRTETLVSDPDQVRWQEYSSKSLNVSLIELY